MSTLFPIAELLMIVLFAATVAAALTKTAPRSVPVDQLDPDDLFAVHRHESASHTDTEFPSTAVC